MIENRMFTGGAAADGGGGGGGDPVGGRAAAATPNYVAGEILIQFDPAMSAAGRDAAIAAIGGQMSQVVRGDLPHQAAEGLLARVSVGQGMDVEQAIAVLSRLPGVSFAEPNYIQTVQATSNDPAYTGGQLWGMYGDGTTPQNQYGSQAGEGWAAGATGSSKVAVGVIDSGVDYTHPDLYLNIWINQREIPTALKAGLIDTDLDGLISFRDLNQAANAAYVTDFNANGRIDAGDLLNDSRWEDGVDNDGNRYVDDLVGWDFVNNDNDPYDDNNHGTHVAGTIAGNGGDGVGVAGVTWSSQIVGLKFLSATGAGSTSNAILAIDYFTTASKGAPEANFVATNNSWGGGGFSQALLDSIGRGAVADILFIAAAGNGGSDGVGDNNDATASYPANYDTTAIAGYDAVISVASITSSGSLSSFSNYGANTVDIGAPGSGIYSTLPGGGYGTFSGTSMATPHVSGGVALYASVKPLATAAEIKAQLLASAAPTASLLDKTLTDGRLDVSNMLGKPPGPTNVYGTTASETVTGTSGADKIWGIPATGSKLGAGTIDQLFGAGGADTFVFGDSRGRFYDDGNNKSAGTGDYAVINDWGVDDRIQLFGTRAGYLQNGVTFSSGEKGMGIYHDSNGNGRFDTRDELIGVVKGQTTALDWTVFDFV